MRLPLRPAQCRKHQQTSGLNELIKYSQSPPEYHVNVLGNAAILKGSKESAQTAAEISGPGAIRSALKLSLHEESGLHTVNAETRRDRPKSTSICCM